jgi:K+-transporting ATPase A subunit
MSFRERLCVFIRLVRRLNQNQSGDMVQDILRIAVIAIPILIILYALVCMLCGTVTEGLRTLGVEVNLDQYCVFGCN